MTQSVQTRNVQKHKKKPPANKRPKKSEKQNGPIDANKIN